MRASTGKSTWWAARRPRFFAWWDDVDAGMAERPLADVLLDISCSSSARATWRGPMQCMGSLRHCVQASPEYELAEVAGYLTPARTP